MKQTIILFFIALSFSSFAQRDTMISNSMPSKEETFEYIRAKTLAYGQGIKNIEIDNAVGSFFNQRNVDENETLCVVVIQYDGGSVIFQNISSLNPNAIAWELKGGILTMQIASVSKEYADMKSYSGKEERRSYTRVLFNASKVADDPKLTDKITKAYCRLIELCGGKSVEKDPFEN